MSAKSIFEIFSDKVSGNFVGEQEIKRLNWILDDFHVNKACVGNFLELTIGSVIFLLLAAWYSILAGYFQNKLRVFRLFEILDLVFCFETFFKGFAR